MRKNTKFNLFDVVEEVSDEFISQTSEISQSNWDDRYFSAITMSIGETKMSIDGKEEDMSMPVIAAEEMFLPIVDIANAMGSEVNIDKATGNIMILYDGEETAIERFSDSDSSNVREFTVLEDGTIIERMETGYTRTRFPVCSVSEAEEALGLEVHNDGEQIIITKPYQLKQIILYVKNGKELKDTYGSEQLATDSKGLYFLQYSSEKQTKVAYETFKVDADIQYVALNNVCTTFTLTDRWSSERISADIFKDYLQKNGKTSRSIAVAVLDTGVDVSHSHLQGRTVAGYNFIDYDNNPYDAHGHGTHVSGTIADCTPANVKIMPIKVLNDYGYGDWFTVAFGIKCAADKGAKVINMSLGGFYSDEDGLVKGVLDYAENKGTLTVVAAGNSRYDTAYFCPAKFDNVVTVAALDNQDLKADFTNYGDSVDIAAPGVDVLSSIPGNLYTYMSGTSMAAPHVSAVAAMLALEYPSDTPSGLKTKIRSMAVDLGRSGWDRIYGAGAIDFRIFFGTKVPENAIYLSDSDLTLVKGEIHELIDKVYPMDATDKSIKFTSSNENVAVFEKRKVIAKGFGTAVLTATTAHGLKATCKVTVGNNWIDYAATSYAGGSGKKNDPYLIATPEQLAKLARDVGIEQKFFKGEYFKLIADIDLAGKNWTPIVFVWSNQYMDSAGFMGSFDGDYHSISNMKITIKNNSTLLVHLGLFGKIGDQYTRHDGCGIQNLAVLKADVDGRRDGNGAREIGILCGSAGIGTTISNCFTTGRVSGGGGLIGEISAATVKNCFSTAKVFSLDEYQNAGFVGGFAASMSSRVNGTDGIICNSYATGIQVDINENYNGAFMYDLGSAGVESSHSIINSFSIGIAQSGFVSVKSSWGTTIIKKCYYLSDNLKGIYSGNAKNNTDLTPKDVTFFKDKSFYKNQSNWDSEYPWDFDNVWAINKSINNGLPYLKGFPLSFYTKSISFAQSDVVLRIESLIRKAQSQYSGKIYENLSGSVPFRMLWINVLDVYGSNDTKNYKHYAMTASDKDYIKEIIKNFKHSVEKMTDYNLVIDNDFYEIPCVTIKNSLIGGAFYINQEDIKYWLDQILPVGKYDGIAVISPSSTTSGAYVTDSNIDWKNSCMFSGGAKNSKIGFADFAYFNLSIPGTKPNVSKINYSVPSLSESKIAIHEWIKTLAGLGDILTNVYLPPVDVNSSEFTSKGIKCETNQTISTLMSDKYYMDYLSGRIWSSKDNRYYGIFPAMWRLIPSYAKYKIGTFNIKDKDNSSYIKAPNDFSLAYSSMNSNTADFKWNVFYSKNNFFSILSDKYPLKRFDVDKNYETDNTRAYMHYNTGYYDAQNFKIEAIGDEISYRIIKCNKKGSEISYLGYDTSKKNLAFRTNADDATGWNFEGLTVFSPNTEGYSFSNSSTSFGYDNGYRIPLERFEEIFEPSLATLFYSWYSYWGGSCFGFSATAGLLYTKNLFLSRYNVETVNKIVRPGNPVHEITKLLERFQISQFLYGVNSKYNYSISELIVAISNFQATGKSPVMVLMSGYGGGHAVIGYKVTQSDTGYIVSLYDNNFPNQTRTLVISADKKTWSNDDYKAYGFNSASGGRLGLISSNTVGENMTEHLDNKKLYLVVSTGNVDIYNSNGVCVEEIESAERIRIYDNQQHEDIAYYLPHDAYRIVPKSGTISDEEQPFMIELSDDETYISTSSAAAFEATITLGENPQLDIENGSGEFELSITTTNKDFNKDKVSVYKHGKASTVSFMGKRPASKGSKVQFSTDGMRTGKKNDKKMKFKFKM